MKKLKELAKPPAKVQKGRAKIAAPRVAKIPKQSPAVQKLDTIGIVAICEKVAEAEVYEAIAAQYGVSRYALMVWLRDHETEYARAREERAHKLADDLMGIADEIDVEAKYEGGNVTLDLSSTAIARNRLRVDTRKWLASKMLPKIYGDRIEMEHSGSIDLASGILNARKRLGK